mgnify:CR=1 FL=1
MDKILIYGVYHFFAFEICQQFLHEGYQVIGIPYPFKANDEEFSLLIGRNANFSEWNKTDQTPDQTEEKTENKRFLFFSHYDQQYLEETQYKEIINHLRSFLAECQIDQTIILQPAEYMARPIDLDRFTAYQEQCSSIVPNPTYVALPPLYGWRQPEKDLFVHLHRSKKEEAMVPKSHFDDILASEEAAAFIVKNMFPHFEDSFLKSKGGFSQFIERLIDKKYKWSGHLDTWSKLDRSQVKIIEVPSAENREERQKEWFQSLKGLQRKNTFHV